MDQYTAVNTSEKLVLFMQRYAYSQKDLSNMIDMPNQTFSSRMKLNNWHLDELRSLNKIRGFKL